MLDSVAQGDDLAEHTVKLVAQLRNGIQHPTQHSLFSPQRTTFGTKHLVFRTDQLIDGIECRLFGAADIGTAGGDFQEGLDVAAYASLRPCL